ncbi:hypothetical protein ACIPI6_15020 [Pseudomonas protegens]|uniref:hypothetical protein n=1 Tax=Pseudomonas protegens TaxID=380021 RepID=UPI00380BDFA0
MQKQILIRLFDLLLLGALVSHYQSAKTFAVAMISIMTAVIAIGFLGMSQETAEKLTPKSGARLALSLAIHALYVTALIFAGYPVLAAIYATCCALIRLAAHSKLHQPKERF